MSNANYWIMEIWALIIIATLSFVVGYSQEWWVMVVVLLVMIVVARVNVERNISYHRLMDKNYHCAHSRISIGLDSPSCLDCDKKLSKEELGAMIK